MLGGSWYSYGRTVVLVVVVDVVVDGLAVVVVVVDVVDSGL